MPQNPSQVLLSVVSGKPTPSPGGKDGSLIIANGYPDYYFKTYNGLSASANAVGVTTSAGLATTYTGLCLSNPAGSGVNLIPTIITAGFDVAPAALTAIGLIGGFVAAGVVTHTTPATVRSTFLGGNSNYTPVGLVDNACTIVGTPAWMRFLSETPATTTVPPFVTLDTKGAIIIPPGGYLAIGTTIAGPTSGLYASIDWLEFPV